MLIIPGMNKMPGCCAEEVESAQFLADVVSKPCEWSPDLCKTFLCACFSCLPSPLSSGKLLLYVSGWQTFFCNGPDSCRRSCISEGGCLCTDAAAKSLPSCLTLCDPMYCSPPGSSVHGILEARILEWVSVPSSIGSSWPRDRTRVSYISCIGRWALYH